MRATGCRINGAVTTNELEGIHILFSHSSILVNVIYLGIGVIPVAVPLYLARMIKHFFIKMVCNVESIVLVVKEHKGRLDARQSILRERAAPLVTRIIRFEAVLRHELLLIVTFESD